MSDADVLPMLDPRACLRVGRKHTQHLPRVLIENNRVVLRTRCGIDPLPAGFTETTTIPTCQRCLDLEAAGEDA